MVYNSVEKADGYAPRLAGITCLSPDSAGDGLGRVRGASHWACCTCMFFGLHAVSQARHICF